MNEFEILSYAQEFYQQNATYTLAVFVLLAINFYLVRRSRELNAVTYKKGILSLFIVMSVYGGWQVATFLRSMQHNAAFRLGELKASGVKVSMASEAQIEFFGNPSAPFESGLPEVPQMIFYFVILVMLLVSLWGKASEGAYDK